MFDPKLVGKTNYAFNPSGTFLVTFYARLALTFCPSSVSIHYYTNMGRNIASVKHLL
jgi:hypothetical protein